MKGFVINIEEATKENESYRKVLYTTKENQLVVMTVQPGDEIGMEVHSLSQFIRIESGKATFILDGVEHVVEDDWAVVIPAGCEHNVINTGTEPLKLYTIYSPPEHRHDVEQVTKADEKEEHFDGVVSE